jgi:hypothetical protein
MNNRKCRQEREFWDRRPGVEIALLPSAETGTVQSTGEKPRQRRAFLDDLCKAQKQQTGWWCAQSGTNASPRLNSLLTGNLQGIFEVFGLIR